MRKRREAGLNGWTHLLVKNGLFTVGKKSKEGESLNISPEGMSTKKTYEAFHLLMENNTSITSVKSIKL